MTKKRRYATGTAHWNSSFDADQVFQIRQSRSAGVKAMALARRYKCNVSTINRLVRCQTYQELTSDQ